jgi:hypothetical protein
MDSLSALIRVSHDGQVLYEGELQAGNAVDLIDGLRIEVQWIRAHTEETEDAT